MQFLASLMNSADLTPHGFCLLWRPELIWLHVVSDTLIGLSYYSIPVALIYFLWRRADLAFGWIFALFAAFILACGTTHWFDVWTLWHPDYAAQGLIKAGTAALSVVTALILWPLLPQALALPSPAALGQEVAERQRAETALLRANEALERRVEERTRALADANAKLQAEIAERRQMTETFRQSTELLGAIVNFSPLAIIGLDAERAITTWNRAAERITGYSAAEMIGKPYPRSEEQEAEARDAMASLIRGQSINQAEIRRQRKDGSPVDFRYAAAPLYDAEQRTRGTVIIGDDVTQRKEAERRINDLQAELLHVSRLSAMGQMASTLAHELNQPLTAVINYLQTLRHLARAGDVARIDEIVEKTVAQAARAGEVIRRLRDFVTKGENERQVEDLNLAVEEAMALAQIGARQQGVRITMRLAPGLAPLLIDKVQIQQVILNLVRNALEAMETSERRELLVATDVAPAASGAELIVADTGPGIAPKIATRLFEPFHTTKENGMGVGLSICRQIVEAHGGRIAVGQNSPCGTVFTVTLPAAAEDEVMEEV